MFVYDKGHMGIQCRPRPHHGSAIIQIIKNDTVDHFFKDDGLWYPIGAYGADIRAHLKGEYPDILKIKTDAFVFSRVIHLDRPTGHLSLIELEGFTDDNIPNYRVMSLPEGNDLTYVIDNDFSTRSKAAAILTARGRRLFSREMIKQEAGRLTKFHWFTKEGIIHKLDKMYPIADIRVR